MWYYQLPCFDENQKDIPENRVILEQIDDDELSKRYVAKYRKIGPHAQEISNVIECYVISVILDIILKKISPYVRTMTLSGSVVKMFNERFNQSVSDISFNSSSPGEEYMHQ